MLPDANLDVQGTLDILNLVRRKLHFSGFPELPLDFPIVELKDDDEGHEKSSLLKSVLGFTDCEYIWPSTDVKGLKYSISFKVKHMAIRVCGLDGLPMSLERILPTFIHELAHACVRGCLSKKGKFKPQKKGKKPVGHLYEDNNSEWQLNPHNHEFYETFSRLLKTAEQTGIFQAGTILDEKDRFSEKSLKKLDDLDIARAPLNIIGSTNLYHESIGNLHLKKRRK